MNALKHSILLAVRDQLESPSWSEEQWWEAFRALFTTVLQRGEDAVYHDSRDDLLFFVVRPPAKQSLMVRRKKVALHAELQIGGEKYHTVDWKKSVLLNYVLQTSFQLTVVCCRQQHLAKVAQGGVPPSDASTVTKQVFASPTKTEVNLDCSRSETSSPAMSYPDICFAVDNFDDAFEDTVLSKGEDCYCVVLHALVDPPPGSPSAASPTQPHLPEQHDTVNGAGSAPTPPTAESVFQSDSEPHPPLGTKNIEEPHTAAETLRAGSDSSSHGEAGLGSRTVSTDEAGMRKVMLFAGYVAYHQIVEFMEASRLRLPFGSWFGLPPQQKEKIIMNGPAGLGRCEVAVTRVLLHPAPWQLNGSHLAAAADHRLGEAGKGANGVDAVAGVFEGGVSHPWADSGVPLDGTSPVVGPVDSNGYVWVDAGISDPSVISHALADDAASLAHTPRGSRGPRGLFAKVQRSVLEVASNIQKAVADSTAMAPSMQCALMALSLPVEVICQRLLEPL